MKYYMSEKMRVIALSTWNIMRLMVMHRRAGSNGCDRCQGTSFKWSGCSDLVSE